MIVLLCKLHYLYIGEWSVCIFLSSYPACLYLCSFGLLRLHTSFFHSKVGKRIIIHLVKYCFNHIYILGSGEYVYLFKLLHRPLTLL